MRPVIPEQQYRPIDFEIDSKGYEIHPAEGYTVNRRLHLAVTVYGYPIGFYCERCKRYVDLIYLSCIYCDLRSVGLETLTADELFRRNGSYRLESTEFTEYQVKQMGDEKLDIHRKFFNDEIEFIKDMDDVQLSARLQELCDFDFELRSRITGVQTKQRERNATRKMKDKIWDVDIDTSVTVTDAINNVNERKKRMSKGDKLMSGLANLLGSDSAANEVLAGIAKLKSGGSVVTPIVSANPRKPRTPHIETSEICRIGDHTECNGRYNDGQSKECHCDCHRTKPTFSVNELFPASPAVQVENVEPFDPSDLFK